MFGLFGAKKKEEVKVPQQVEKVIDLADTSNRLGNNMNDVKLKLEVTEKELKTALEQLRIARTPQQKVNAKTKATNLLKKKKMYDSHLNTLQNTQFNVENAHIQTSMMKDNMDIMTTMKATVNVQKQMMGNMNADSVYDMMDDMRELQDDQNEINDAFQRNYEVEIGDDELDAELDELDYQMRVEFDANDLKVPGRKILSKEDKDERELNDLLK